MNYRFGTSDGYPIVDADTHVNEPPDLWEKRVPKKLQDPFSRRPIELEESYVRAVEKLESLPQNRSGSDKTWVERAVRGSREHHRKAVRVR